MKTLRRKVSCLFRESNPDSLAHRACILRTNKILITLFMWFGSRKFGCYVCAILRRDNQSNILCYLCDVVNEIISYRSYIVSIIFYRLSFIYARHFSVSILLHYIIQILNFVKYFSDFILLFFKFNSVGKLEFH